jgi:hypothetical protein
MANFEDLILRDTRSNQPAAGVPGRLYYVTDENVTERDNGSAWEDYTDGSTGGGAIYPQDCISFIHQFKVSSGIASGFTKNIDTAQQFNTQYFQTATPANGDAVITSIVLKDGTYDVYVLGVTANNRGKIDWALDGGAAFISAQDWYNGSTQQNIIKTGTVTISASGRHLLSATINGKNGSSSGYYMVFTAIWFVAQSQTTET